jgi:hypothetical protein
MPDENMISSMVDTQLMLTIAQASATFVAIMAGFFTTKIISISSDKKRIESKIAEDDIKRQGKEMKIMDYKEIIGNIERRKAERSVDSFVNDLLDEPLLNIYTLEQLKHKYAEKYMFEPNEYEIKILDKEYGRITKKIQKEMEDRAVHFKITGNIRTSATRSYLVRNIMDPETENRENEELDEMYKKIQLEENEIAILDNLKHHYEAEKDAISYPLTNLAFISQLIFVVTGIVIPFNYNWWAPSLHSWFDTNEFGLIMFYIGLSSAFCYLGLELLHSLHTEKFNRFIAFITRNKVSNDTAIGHRIKRAKAVRDKITSDVRKRLDGGDFPQPS